MRVYTKLLLVGLLTHVLSMATLFAQDSDREHWSDLLYRLSAPVLSNMSEGKLQENMLVEVSPTWDGRDVRVTYMEAFGRLMAGLAPWLSLPDDNTEEGKKRLQLKQWALKSYANAVDPNSRIIYCGAMKGNRWWMQPILPIVFYVLPNNYGNRWIV